MGPEGKEKKRKAATPVAVAAPKAKKTKKAKPATSELTKDDLSATPIPTAQPAAPKSSSMAEIQANPTVRPRKRAVDFLSDDEEKDGGVLVTKSTDAEAPLIEKPKKKNSKKDKLAVNGEASATTTSTEPAPQSTVNASNTSSDVSAAPKPEKTRADPKSGEAAITSEDPSTLPTPKKKGPSNVDVHAEKIKKLLGQKDVLPKQNQKTKKVVNVPAVSLTADGVNRISSKAENESLDVAAKDEASTSMQAEAAQTAEKELHDEYESEEEIDQAAALLEGFDSDTEDLAQDAGFDKNKPTGAFPNYKKTQKKLRQATQKGNKDGPGTVYVGRIPHGFYETEMRQYFSQFGTISKLRLSRNRKSGHSKHFAFLEFESNEVAKIVSETMDNYLLFGHILKCKYVESESLHPDTFKGANKRFRVAPHNRMEKRTLEAPKSESQWKKKNSKEQSRREKRAEKLKAMDYEIELPKLKSPTEVLQKRESRVSEKEEGPKVSGTDGKGVPIPTTVPDDEVALSEKKSKKGRNEGANTAETKRLTPPTMTMHADASTPVSPENGAERDSEKRDKRKEKRENAKKETRQLRAPMIADETLPVANDQPAKAGAEATTVSSGSAKISQSSKPKKKKGGGENAPVAADETPVPAIAKPESAPVEEEALPPIAPAENVEESKTKKKSKKRKSSGADDELAGPEPRSTEPLVKRSKEKVNGEATRKSILKKAKKAS